MIGIFANKIGAIGLILLFLCFTSLGAMYFGGCIDDRDDDENFF